MIEFKEKFIEKFPGVDLNKKIYAQMDYVDFLLTSIPKIIVSMGNEEMFNVVCNERFSYVGDHYNGDSPNRSLMVKFVFECESVGRKDGLSGELPIQLLSKEYPKTILNFFVKSPININQMFESDRGLKTKYCEMEY